LIEGRANLALESTVCLNAGAALWIAEKTPDLKSGVLEAKKLLTTGPVATGSTAPGSFSKDHKA